jgi:hypothetical protein
MIAQASRLSTVLRLRPATNLNRAAPILHLLGLDHTKLTYRFQGRDFRLTDVEGELVEKVIA